MITVEEFLGHAINLEREAAERFGQMVALQGGPADFVSRYADHLPKAPVIRPVPGDGLLAGWNTRAVGEAVVHLGGGRLKGDDVVDPRVGFSDIAEPGDTLGPDRPLALVHAADEAGAEAAIAALQAAARLGEAPKAAPLVQEHVA